MIADFEVLRLRRLSEKPCEQVTTRLANGQPIPCREMYECDADLCEPCRAARKLWLMENGVEID